MECERANQTDPAGVQAVHRAISGRRGGRHQDQYLQPAASGGGAAAGLGSSWRMRAGKLAAKAAGGDRRGAFVFADLGPAPDTEEPPGGAGLSWPWQSSFALLGARNFLFETLSTEEGVLEADSRD